MKTVVYTSGIGAGFNEHCIRDILKTAREKNAKHGLTGLLLFKDYFFQVLEGPDAEVDQCIRNIRGDERNCNVLVMMDHPIKERAFPDWKMGFVATEDFSEEQQRAVDGLIMHRNGESPEKGSDAVVSALIDSFLDRTRR